jgi:hypothetical protein
VEEESKPDANDERPPICPACGVTMRFIVDEDGTTRDLCLECGFSDEVTLPSDDSRLTGADRALGSTGRGSGRRRAEREP